jgi:kynurenine/2-aminoadipate aminotransferase
MRPDSLAAVLDAWDVAVQGPRPRVVLTIPTGSNPSGGSMTIERKRAIYEIASAPDNDLLVFEDDPYYYLQFAEQRTPSLLSMDVDGRVLRFDSFSKVLASGIRIGFVSGPPKLVERVGMHMQCTTLHTSGVSQIVVQALFEHWDNSNAAGDGFEQHVRSICAFYLAQRDAFLASVERHLSGLVELNTPRAGMFVWMKLLGVDDSQELIQTKAVEKLVLLMPGSAFQVTEEPTPYVRISYSTASPEEMDQACLRLAELLRDEAQK